MTPEAAAYLNEGLDYIQGNSIKREQIDWQTFRQEISALVAEAQTPAETYPALEIALKRLDDHHSVFSKPEDRRLLKEGKMHSLGLQALYPEGIVGVIVPSSPAEQAGIQVGDRIERINDQLVPSLTRDAFKQFFREKQIELTILPAKHVKTRQVRLEAALFSSLRLPQGRRIAHAIGYLHLPGFSGSSEQAKTYAATIQQLISEIDQEATSGWVIDLRRDTGGNMWPMVAGVGPILGESEWLVFVAPWEKLIAFYRGGQAGYRDEQAGKDSEQVYAEVEHPYQLKRSEPPVAVLTSKLTASSGEFTALAFRGLPRVCTFGEPTLGVPTATDNKDMSDGATIFLTVNLGADRTGQTHDSPLLPDCYVKIDWTELGTDNDPVLQAAIRWLQTENGCL